MEILVKDLIDEAIGILENENIADAQLDSWLLAEHILGINKTKFYMNPQISVSGGEAHQYLEKVKLRANKIPLQYITGMQEFMGFNFNVNKDVLIPRQDTELLVENVVEYINFLNRKVKVLDMCTGSGCIAISVDKLCPQAEVIAVDISDKALNVAKENSKINNSNVKFVQSDLFDGIEEKFDVIISNPPYIKTKEVENLMEEVKEHEPRLALDGDDDGLKFYRLISRDANSYLNNGGMIMFEIGYDQGETVPEILREVGFEDIKVYKDLSGNDRVVIAGKE